MEKINFEPTSVDRIQSIISKKIEIGSVATTGYKYVLRKNVAYNCQYLEYLDYQIISQDISHNVILKLHYKMFILTAFSIIEGILYHELKEKGLIKKEEYLEYLVCSNQKEDILIKNYIYKKDNSENRKDEYLKTKDIFSRAQKNDLLGVDSRVYSELNSMRKFRDKIHIHISDSIEATDYNSFNVNLYNRQKKIFVEVFKIYFSLSEIGLKLQVN